MTAVHSAESNFTIDDVVIDSFALSEAMRKSFTRDPFDHYVNGLCGLFICLLGTLSNAMSFSVLIRRTMQLSTYVYLAGLCLSDFTACLFLIPSCILDAYPIEVPDYELPRTYAFTRVLIVSGVISTTARVLSVWLCVAFTIDRWIMICRPFVGPLYCTMKNARYVTSIIYLIGVFYAIPLMFEYEPYEDRGLSDLLFVNHKFKFFRRKPTFLGRNPTFRWIYVLINAVGVYLVPLSIIAVLNRKLLISIRLLEKRSAELNAPLPTKQGVTIMLLATTVMLLVFRSPSAIISVLWLISAKMFVNEKSPFPLRKFHSIANLCASLNAATTFIMFIIYGTKFRSEFKRIYCCCWSKIGNRWKILTQKSEETHIELLIPRKTFRKDSPHLNSFENPLKRKFFSSSSEFVNRDRSSRLTTETSVGSIRFLSEKSEKPATVNISANLHEDSVETQIELQSEQNEKAQLVATLYQRFQNLLSNR